MRAEIKAKDISQFTGVKGSAFYGLKIHQELVKRVSDLADSGLAARQWGAGQGHCGSKVKKW